MQVRRRLKNKFTLTLSCWFLHASWANATARAQFERDASDVPLEQEFEEPTEEGRTLEERALDFSKFISQKIERVAESIDITLAGKKYTKKTNPSSVNINQFVTYSEGGSLKTSTDFGVNLRLPNLERRWQVRFSSYDEDKENRDLTQRRIRTRERPKDYGAAFQLFQNLGKIKTTFQPRLQIKDPVDISYILRFETESKHNKKRLIPRLDLFTDPKKGTGQFFSLELQVELSKRADLSIQNTEEYRDHENFFTTQHSVSYDYSLNMTQAVGASANATANNRATYHLESFTFAGAFTQEIFKNLLKYSLTPFISFTKGEHFKGRTGITLNVEATF